MHIRRPGSCIFCVFCIQHPQVRSVFCIQDAKYAKYAASWMQNMQLPGRKIHNFLDASLCRVHKGLINSDPLEIFITVRVVFVQKTVMYGRIFGRPPCLRYCFLINQIKTSFMTLLGAFVIVSLNSAKKSFQAHFYKVLYTKYAHCNRK